MNSFFLLRHLLLKDARRQRFLLAAVWLYAVLAPLTPGLYVPLAPFLYPIREYRELGPIRPESSPGHATADGARALR